MAEQSINLNNYPASGVYTIEVDESQNTVLPLTTGRLIVGSSRVGPFNTVVLINDVRTLRAVYGDIDPKLEKAGSFFHRTIEVALREGPVFALNVIPLDTETDVTLNTDKTLFTTFNTESSSNNNLQQPKEYPIVEFFNRRRLWVADAEQLNRSKNLALGDDYINNFPGLGITTPESNKILSFANLGNSNVTIWVKRAMVKGFDVTAREWYSTIGGGKEIEYPPFVHKDDFISDYFVEVIVVNGDWTNHMKLSKDPIFKKYFDESGLIIAKSSEFFAIRQIKVINRVVGCLIPDFKDQKGATISIDRLVNKSYPTTGILCALDTSKLDLIDLSNSSFIDQDVHTHRVDIIGQGYDDLNLLDSFTADDGGYDSALLIADPTPLIDTLSYNKPGDKDLVFKLTNNPSVNPTLDESAFLSGYQDTLLTTSVATGDTYLVDPGTSDTYIVALEGSTLYTSFKKGFVKTGDEIKDGSNTLYVKVIENLTVNTPGPTVITIPYIRVLLYSDISLINQESFDINTSYGCYTGIDNEDYINLIIASGANFKYDFDLSTDFLDYTIQQPNKLILGISLSNKALVDEFIKVNQYIKAKSNSGRTRFLKIISISSSETLSPYSLTYTVTTMGPTEEDVDGIDITGGTLKVYKGIHNFVTTLKGQYLKGFKIQDTSLPNSSAARQSSILEYLFTDTTIPQALANGELVDFRYVVDSYEGELSESSKYYLVKLAALNGQAMAIVNAPSIQQFERSVDPSFIDTSSKLVSCELIAQGGNLDLNPSFTFKFAEEDVNGVPLSSYASYHFPNLIIRSGTKNISVPQAAYISNLYVRKFKNGTPFLIVAGGKRGAINDPEVVGLEYDLTDLDRGFLEPVGFNLTVKKKGYGIILFSNNTGYQRLNSALNSAHVRDNLSTIEKDLEKILFNFLFDFNDEITRLRVSTNVKNYLDAVVGARGISTYSVTFNSSNNTEDVISARTAIIDIQVDFPRGIHKFINRITLTKVGGELSSQSTGFIPSF